MRQLNLAQAKAHLSELIDAAMKGEEVVISRRNKPVVKLTPIVVRGRKPRFGTLKAGVLIAPDFDAPLPGFAAYTNPAVEYDRPKRRKRAARK